MDPDANLAEQRRLIQSMRYDMDTGRTPDEIDVDRFINLVEALDAWIARGGALPKAWKP